MYKGKDKSHGNTRFSNLEQMLDILVQGGFQLGKLLSLLLECYNILGLGVSLLLQQGPLMHLTAFCELLQSVFQLELRAVAVPLPPAKQ